ncbi:head-tail connector protein [Paenirhodobacter populi]|uniref:Phage gp6-like head-tail connector protein n=1 Tax=Paenirhodobacter populi TaxID=2306993 RepID=A0A443JKS8_9RHOB|nr:head-tail connector protein [Sinirhodobacter populi]RWR21134.1 phage gp6-like head-tail connector protein [Sinirhodobacter populi]
MPISPALIRAHLNIDDDRDAELLEHYANVAESYVASYTGQPFTADNPLMVQAALLLIACQYESREAVSFSSVHQLPFGVFDLLASLKERVTGYVPEGGAA